MSSNASQNLPETGPRETSPGGTPRPRMADLAKLPVFLGLAGRRAVVAGGGGYGGPWKAELLGAAGARVEVYAPEPCAEMLALAADWPERITIVQRAWEPGDLVGAAVAIGVIEDEEVAGRFVAAARAAGAPVNVVDKPAFCDFQFGAIVNRSPLVIGISTDGGAPTLGQVVRARIEALLPLELADWAAAAKAWRGHVQAHVRLFAARRRFWQLFADRAIAAGSADVPTEAVRGALLTEAVSGVERRGGRGSLVLVGAGPGDPGLLTMKAVRALQTADIVLYDDLVSVGVLDLARREARKMHVGERDGGPSCRQESCCRQGSCCQDEIGALAVSLAGEGHRVVRLTGGDPMQLGRAGEEIAAARAGGIEVEVVPGITAAQGAAASLACPLTHRDRARRVQYVTGRDREGGLLDGLDWRALADPRATTVVTMGRRTLPALARRTIGLGLPAETPLVAVVNATCADEQVIVTTMGEAARSALTLPDGPTLILYGNALSEVGGQVRTAMRQVA